MSKTMNQIPEMRHSSYEKTKCVPWYRISVNLRKFLSENIYDIDYGYLPGKMSRLGYPDMFTQKQSYIWILTYSRLSRHHL